MLQTRNPAVWRWKNPWMVDITGTRFQNLLQDAHVRKEVLKKTTTKPSTGFKWVQSIQMSILGHVDKVFPKLSQTLMTWLTDPWKKHTKYKKSRLPWMCWLSPGRKRSPQAALKSPKVDLQNGVTQLTCLAWDPAPCEKRLTNEGDYYHDLLLVVQSLPAEHWDGKSPCAWTKVGMGASWQRTNLYSVPCMFQALCVLLCVLFSFYLLNCPLGTRCIPVVGEEQYEGCRDVKRVQEHKDDWWKVKIWTQMPGSKFHQEPPAVSQGGLFSCRANLTPAS